MNPLTLADRRRAIDALDSQLIGLAPEVAEAV